MILKELNLISFGKFQNKRLDFDEGINILYGENESGKTTIHNFIDGMFYGFLKPYVTKRYFLEEYEKYRPWNGNQYMGILKIIKDGKKYRIERDFDRGEVKVYDELTARDITDYIDNGEKLKIHLPGLYFFDFNTAVYKNTISIKQLGNKIDSTLSTEVKDRLANISTSLDDEISVKLAMSHLEKELDKIGTDRAYTKPYGKSIVQLNKLKEKHKLALEKQKEYNKAIDEFYVLKEEIEDKQKKFQQFKIQLDKAKLFKKKQIYEDVLSLEEEIKLLDKDIETLKPYSDLNFNDYSIGLKLENSRESLDKEIQGLLLRINNLEYNLKEKKFNEDQGIIKGIKAEELFEDVNTYNEMEEEKNNLILNNQQNRLEILNGELKNLEDRLKKGKAKGHTFILLTIVSLGLILINPFLIALSLIFIGLFFVSRKANRGLNGELENLNNNIRTIKLEEDTRKNRLDHIEKDLREIILRYDCSSKLELNRLYEDIRLNQISQNQEIEAMNQLNVELKESKSILNIKKKERENKIHQLKEILLNNNSSSLEEFKDGLDKKQNYENLLMDRKGKLEIIDRILGNTSIEELKTQLSSYDDKYFEDIKVMDVTAIEDKIKSIEQNILTLKDSYSRLEERIDNLNKDIKYLVDIQEEIKRVEEKIQYYKNKTKSIEIAKSTIEGISQEIHTQFAPKINKQVSKLIHHISNGRYEQVKVNDDLNITVENPSTKEIVPIDSLSGGTIDQLYFALRFSIISSMKGDNLPLLLDDCFIQYDDERLKNILCFLGDIGKEKQILLFTCHKREREILDELGLNYNLIDLR